MATPEEVEQLVNEKITLAISVYEALRSINVRNEATGGQGTIRNIGDNVARAKREHGKDAMQHQNKKQKIVKEEKNVKREYFGNHHYSSKCDKHHPGQCLMVCGKCRRMGHKAKDCRIIAPTAKTISTGVCYECREMGHYRDNCPKLRNSMFKKIQGKAPMKIPKKVVETDDAGEGYKGKFPYCVKCDMHHTGRCIILCNKCKQIGHKAKDCKISAPVPITTIPMTCHKCGEAGCSKKNYPMLRQQNAEPTKGKIYVIANGGDHQKLE